MTWEFQPVSLAWYRIRFYKKRTWYKGPLGPGMKALPLSIGDSVFQKMPRPLNGQTYIQRFRLRMARGQPAVHLGKKFGDRWYWLHTKTGQAILRGLIPRRDHAGRNTNNI